MLYEVTVLEVREIHEIPDAWGQQDFLNLLGLIEYEDIESISAEDLKEMTVMALSDLSPAEAAAKVLELRLGEKISKGKRQHLAEEFKDERLWEEYPEIALHEELFNAACMLYWAFAKVFPEPDAICIVLRVKSLEAKSLANLLQPTASFIARLLDEGMGESNDIHRLFHDTLASKRFSEADDIIWKFKHSAIDTNDNSITLTLYTSANWVDEMKQNQTYTSKAFADSKTKN